MNHLHLSPDRSLADGDESSDLNLKSPFDLFNDSKAFDLFEDSRGNTSFFGSSQTNIANGDYHLTNRRDLMTDREREDLAREVQRLSNLRKSLAHTSPSGDAMPNHPHIESTSHFVNQAVTLPEEHWLACKISTSPRLGSLIRKSPTSDRKVYKEERQDRWLGSPKPTKRCVLGRDPTSSPHKPIRRSVSPLRGGSRWAAPALDDESSPRRVVRSCSPLDHRRRPLECLSSPRSVLDDSADDSVPLRPRRCESPPTILRHHSAF